MTFSHMSIIGPGSGVFLFLIQIRIVKKRNVLGAGFFKVGRFFKPGRHPRDFFHFLTVTYMFC